MAENNEELTELEEQFILRLPLKQAQKLRHLLRNKPKKLKKNLQIFLDIDEKCGSVMLKKCQVPGRLRRFPTIIESYKILPNNNKQLVYKTADICQMLDCTTIDGNYEMLHGLSAPLKNVRKQRFRKCLSNKDQQSLDVQKELIYLLQADLDAVHSRFEIIEDRRVEQQSTKCREIKIFGEILSDSEATDSN